MWRARETPRVSPAAPVNDERSARSIGRVAGTRPGLRVPPVQAALRAGHRARRGLGSGSGSRPVPTVVPRHRRHHRDLIHLALAQVRLGRIVLLTGRMGCN
jgi:hypothetical protein